MSNKTKKSPIWKIITVVFLIAFAIFMINSFDMMFQKNKAIGKAASFMDDSSRDNEINNPVKEIKKEKQKKDKTKKKKTFQDINKSIAIEIAILDYTNYKRKQHGIQPLKLDDNLQSIARIRSKDMDSRNIKKHKGENTAIIYVGDIEEINHLIDSSDNIAKALINMWMKDPKSRKNILDEDYTSMVVGVSYGRDNYRVIQKFS